LFYLLLRPYASGISENFAGEKSIVKRSLIYLATACLFAATGTPFPAAFEMDGPIVADHTCVELSRVPEQSILKAREVLKIAYGHTSHGSQLVTGMKGLADFKGDLYSFGGDGADGGLELRDNPFSGAHDLGNPDRVSWEAATRRYLDGHPGVNVIIWSWCGQVSSASESDIDTYLTLMSGLEESYPGVMFVYMTGHLDGTGLDGNLHLRNEQIRKFCRENNKILYDFADIESYDPDGNYFGDRIPNDNCDYDSDGDGRRDSNWAIEWQSANPGRWYDCSSAHSQPLNANMKAHAAWWLWARLAECTCGTGVGGIQSPRSFRLGRNYPNPFNSSTVITFSITRPSSVNLSIYNTAGQKVKTLLDGRVDPGDHSASWDGTDGFGNEVTSGMYFYRLRCENDVDLAGKMLYLK